MMTGDNFAATPLIEDTFENELMTVRKEMSESEVAPRMDRKEKKKSKNPNGRREQFPASAPQPAADIPSPIPQTRIQPPQEPTLGQISTPATEAPMAVDAVMDLFGVIPEAVNDVAQLASSAQKFLPLKPAVIALALGAGAAFVAFMTLRGEQ